MESNTTKKAWIKPEFIILSYGNVNSATHFYGARESTIVVIGDAGNKSHHLYLPATLAPTLAQTKNGGLGQAKFAASHS